MKAANPLVDKARPAESKPAKQEAPSTAAAKDGHEDKKKDKKEKKKHKKDEDGPKRPLSAYMLYNNYRRPMLREQDPSKFKFFTYLF